MIMLWLVFGTCQDGMSYVIPHDPVCVLCDTWRRRGNQLHSFLPQILMVYLPWAQTGTRHGNQRQTRQTMSSSGSQCVWASRKGRESGSHMLRWTQRRGEPEGNPMSYPSVSFLLSQQKEGKRMSPRQVVGSIVYRNFDNSRDFVLGPHHGGHHGVWIMVTPSVGVGSTIPCLWCCQLQKRQKKVDVTENPRGQGTHGSPSVWWGEGGSELILDKLKGTSVLW